MTFSEVLDRLSDGKAYEFGHEHLDGAFYKAPFPEDLEQTEIDGAISAITFWNVKGARASPTLMLYDFDNDGVTEWYCIPADKHPSKR